MLHGSALCAVKILSEIFNLLLGGKIPTADAELLSSQYQSVFIKIPIASVRLGK